MQMHLMFGNQPDHARQITIESETGKQKTVRFDEEPTPKLADRIKENTDRMMKTEAESPTRTSVIFESEKLSDSETEDSFCSSDSLSGGGSQLSNVQNSINTKRKKKEKPQVVKRTRMALGEDDGAATNDLHDQINKELEGIQQNSDKNVKKTEALVRQITTRQTNFDKKLQKQVTQMQKDVDLVSEIRAKVQAAVEKWQKQKGEIVEVLREEVKFQVGLHVNDAIDQMNRLKDYISKDMKKWANQRSDLQVEIAKISEKISAF